MTMEESQRELTRRCQRGIEPKLREQPRREVISGTFHSKIRPSDMMEGYPLNTLSAKNILKENNVGPYLEILLTGVELEFELSPKFHKMASTGLAGTRARSSVIS